MNYENLTLHTDKYQINMMYAHWLKGTYQEKAVFEVYFRKLPFDGGYAVFAGLERLVHYIKHLRFGDDEIAYLREQEEHYREDFLEALRAFKFSGDLQCVPEGTLVFPNVPLVRVVASIFEAQFVETAILNFVNYQTLIATKASRIKQVVPNEVLLEFGTRRAQEADAAIWGARAAYIAGFHATSNLRAGMLFGIPTKGTHAHAWVQAFDTEEEAFRVYAEALPEQVTLLVDTYDTLRSGVPNAIKIARMLQQQGKRMNAIRLDSGDLAYLSQQARLMLDEAGFPEVAIVASNDLDENIIEGLKAQGAKIDVWGVGTQLITAADQPALGGVYKLVALEKNGSFEPVIKISGNPEKVSNPGFKEAYRIINKKTGKAEADYLAMEHEVDIQRGERVKLFDPTHTYIYKYIEDYEAVPLLKPIFTGGELVYELPTLDEIRAYHKEQIRTFWPQYLRKLNPEGYRVNLSTELWELKMNLIHAHTIM
ncbi:nicotinate phosphoribosyltransferase [Paenibacillus sp. CGMCC 1.16610]|uniref:Nicotinate phosphoribosyltransferase n=2 Tax=Paenibacillus TaxID=44249 RepID=A0ABU6D6Z0_9BACL|nr:MULTISPECIES: nicotinate phosphoribosyltransferase [Paenibacillus]MBA2944190.1 nicotinate phosphoribosyltransferase [Paenibacillus sp. CGMCC 1.16610]MCY9661139.1 nicotinate phosphoribosyltransferase [Paenibacillus anseongense]MEB4793511.1 nicotinate phosphoribosyltransferase [Paenibacillus chondroitinus]MVQ38080.1 nicotinate phosphoribosyltransferase [Paenibacillus anseongense]